MPTLPADIATTVTHALAEDLGDGDVTAELLKADEQAEATIICREAGIFCGKEWCNETFKQVNPDIKINWNVADGDTLSTDEVICTITGNARDMVIGERVALNFMQTLSGTASEAKRFANRIKGTKTIVRDTRKTLPGLRLAQKYAVACGGCENHRLGLYDAYLIKENHIAACDSITLAVQTAKANMAATGKELPLEVEAETIEQVDESIRAGADLVLLDNFSIPLLNKAVALNKQLTLMNISRAKLEASGGITWENARSIADTGVDYIAVGALTKDLKALDLSMRFSNA